MVAGPNGSGKTTVIQALRAARDIKLPGLYVNADDVRRERRLDARTAQKLAQSLRWEAIVHGRSLMYETVMSHPSKIAELQSAARAGYEITVIFIATDDPEVNVERVSLRVADGGHDVPKDRIRARHARSIALAPSAIGFATHAYVYDNSGWGTRSTQQLQAVRVGAALRATVERPAPWVRAVVETVNARAAELERLYRSANVQPLVVPNFFNSVCNGVVVEVGSHYVLQADRAGSTFMIHDKALLAKPVTVRQNYRIEYDQGVSKVLRRSNARISAVKKAAK